MIAGPIFDEEELYAADEGWLDGLHMLRQEESKEKHLRKFKENNSKQYQRKQKDKERTLQKRKERMRNYRNYKACVNNKRRGNCIYDYLFFFL